ncbi:MAG: prepilin-type N-terminal cleavage/methylation domain-containing protein [Gammaproteobacteria bacterium]|nr:prepilin-type N-terminal cleavage/methylation domain-containing protein [Gammaproteobacteria bacterium]
MRYASRTQSGFTLIEVVIVVVLLGIMMAGMTQVFVSTIGRSHEPALRQKALAAAEAVMDEIVHKAWDDNTPLGGGCVASGTGACSGGPAAAGIGTEETGRTDYDDVDDYNTVRDQDPPRDAEDQVMNGYAGFSLSVFVDQTADWNGIPAGDVKRIRVQVTTPTQETITLTAFRVNI